MCGIIGYIGKSNAIEVLNFGLKQLEYRGYDSAGISFFENNKLTTIKKAGTVDKLFVNIKNKICHVGIGHTRWATHGKPIDENSHPHTSCRGKVSLVHNGIIENYLELKEKYLKNTPLKSETDTEVVVNLIENFLIAEKNKKNAILKTMKLLKGSYALGILFDDEQHRIYFAKNKSPLLIGCGEKENFLSSDLLGFANKTNKYILLENEQMGWISTKSINIFNIYGKKVSYLINIAKDYCYNSNKGNYKYYMLKEIYEIPDCMEKIGKVYGANKSPLLQFDKNFIKKYNRIWLIGCGTSYHACLAGEKFFNQIGFDASCRIASEFVYCPPKIDCKTLCIFLSQSGETADTLSAMNISHELGATTITLTNVTTSQLAINCDYVLPLCSGPEIAVASTKAYNSQLCVLKILTEYFDKHDLKIATNWIKNCKNAIDFKKLETEINPIVKELLKTKTVFLCGKNFDYVTSLESALKIKEISYINAQGISSGELKHGTIALVDDKTLVFSFLTQEDLFDKTLNIVNQTKARGAKIVAVTNIKNKNLNNFDYVVNLPKMRKELSPIISILPMQLLAYKTTVALGYDPDKPRNLAKSVTVE